MQSIQRKNCLSSALISKEAKNDILQFTELGQKRHEEFVFERLKMTSKRSVVGQDEKNESKNFFQLDGQEKSASRR